MSSLLHVGSLAVVPGLLTAVASLAAANGSGAQSPAVAPAKWLHGRWVFPGQGSDLCPLHLQVESYPLCH